MHNNSFFQNIIYALIIRTKDGLPLSATTDFTDEINKNIKECKRYVKLVSKKAQTFPERCSLNLHQHNIFFITHLGVTYLVLCSYSYPPVLAFSFLNELMKEFITVYDQRRIQEVIRPYSFMEFDNFIHKTCQRYNKPQSLTTRINLSELSLEVRLRPPYQISIEEVEPAKNNHLSFKVPYSVGHRLQYEDLSFFSFMMMIMTIILSAVSALRGISAIHDSSYEELTREVYVHGILFLTESVLRILQVMFLIYQMRFRKIFSWIECTLLCYLLWSTSQLRDDWQNILFVSVTIFMHFCIILRRTQSKLPEYSV